jgi:uncharacterized protein YaaW (UPF0174 family)
MKITISVMGHGLIPGTNTAQYAVLVTFGGPVETMTITVVVDAHYDEATGKAVAIARAKELAQLFVASPPV